MKMRQRSKRLATASRLSANQRAFKRAHDKFADSFVRAISISEADMARLVEERCRLILDVLQETRRTFGIEQAMQAEGEDHGPR